MLPEMWKRDDRGVGIDKDMFRHNKTEIGFREWRLPLCPRYRGLCKPSVTFRICSLSRTGTFVPKLEPPILESGTKAKDFHFWGHRSPGGVSQNSMARSLLSPSRWAVILSD